MTTFNRRQFNTLLGAGTLTLATGKVRADAHGPTVHEVLMLNAHPDDRTERNVFLPDIVRAMPGDTIRFIAEDRGHNSVSDGNMLPEGAQEWRGRINEEFEITVEVDGTYGYYCQPHRALGMVGLILVGDAEVNFAEAQEARQPGKAADRYEDIFARARTMLDEEA